MIRRLDRYVLKIFIASIAAGVLFASGLLVLVDQFQHFDDLLQAPKKLREAGFRDLAKSVFPMSVQFYAYEIAIRFFQYCPFVTFFAAVFTASRLHRSNETVAMLATGTSLQRAFAMVFLASAGVTGLQLAFRETLLPKLAMEQAVLRSILLENNPAHIIKNLSVVDRAGNHYTFNTYNPREHSGGGFSAYGADPKVYKNITAKEARFEEESGPLQLVNGLYYSVSRDAVKAGDAKPVAELPAEFVISCDDCEVAARAQGDPDYLSISELDSLARRSPNIYKYQVSLHAIFTLAIANFILPLLGLPCVLRGDRRSTLEGAAFAFLLVVLYFAATLFCYQLGAQGTWSTVFAAWLPTVIFGSLGIVLFDGMKT